MPSKRQPSKQRRAAQNRATRAQLEARRQRAGELRSSAPEGASGSGSDAQGEPEADTASSSGRPGGLLSGLLGGGGSRSDQPGGLLSGLFGGGAGGASQARPRPEPVNATGLIATRPDGTRLPGARAAFVALVLAAVAWMFLLAIPLFQVDDRGEVAPPEFQGLFLEARSELAGEEVELTEVTFIDAYGVAQFLPLILPVAMVAFSWYMHRKTGLSRPLTIGMLAMAVVAVLTGFLGQFFIPALIALAVGSFQARKAELPARMAERMGRGQESDEDDDEDDDVIDVDSVDADEDEVDDDEDLDDEDEEDEANAKRR